MVEGGEQARRDLWPWQKEVLATVEAAIVEKQAGARPRLERVLRAVEPDFKTLLKNPPPNPRDAEMIRKATSEGITLPGCEAATTLTASLVEEALIVSDLFQLNELSAALLVVHGEEQLPQYPGLTRGLVAVLLYYDGRKALVQALRTLMAGRPGLTWSTDTHPDIADLVKDTTSSLMGSGLVATILSLLASLDWTSDLAGLQKAAALGDPQHVHTVASLHQDIRQNLADCLYCYSAQSGLSSQAIVRVMEHLARHGTTTATGALDGVSLTLVLAVLASMDLTGSGREEAPLVAEGGGVAAVGREVEGRGRKWEQPGVLALLQLAWAAALAALRQGSAPAALAAALEEDEMFVELALEGRVFHTLPSLLLASPEFRKEEFYLRRVHGLLADFLALMPLKVKELRNRADDGARNQLMHEQEGIQYSVPVPGQHFPLLLQAVAALYRGDPGRLALSTLYWAPSGDSGEQGRSHCSGRQVQLYKFVRLAGDLLMPSLFVPYCSMLTGLADAPAAAPHCFKLLKLNGASSSNVCLDHFFQSLHQYHANLQQQGRGSGGPDHTIYRTQPLTKGISPQEVAGLAAVLDLATVLADRSEEARVAMAEHPGWSVVPTVLGLLACSVPTTIKARLVSLLAALARSPDLVHPLWQALEAAGLCTPGRPGIPAELEEVEARAEAFPLTRAFLGLLDRLTDTELPAALGAGQRQPGFQPYLAFLQDSVLLRFQTRTYKDPGEKWEVAALCLGLLHKLAAEYQPRVEDFQGQGHHPGFHILGHLHQTSQLLRTVLFVVDEARALLDTFSPLPGKAHLEAAATAALRLLDTALGLSEAFITCGRAAGTSTVLTGLPHLLLGLNPRSGKPDHLLNVSRFVLFGYWLPAARLAAVRVIGAVAASPANQAPILATFTSSPAVANAVLKAFTEALDAEEEEEETAAGTRAAVVELLQAGLAMPAPSLANFLLGFDLKKGVARCQLQSPGVTGVRTPLHALLTLLAPAAPGVPPPTAASAPSLLTAAYQLVFTLVSSPTTSEPVLRFLRSSSDFLCSSLACVTSLLSPATVHAQRSAAWLLRAVAVEVRVLARGRQTGALAKVLGLLLDTADAEEVELGAGSSLYQDATFSQLSRTVAHSSGRQAVDTASVHRLALVLNTIDFETELLSAPTWELFDDSQVAGVLEQCRAPPRDGAAELLVDVPALHRILAAELAAIQGSAAAGQRALVTSEIEAILTYAVRWNAVQEGAGARRDLLDAWRQVTETLINVIPADLLPAAGKQQILLQLLQSLLNRVSGEAPVHGMDTLVSSTVLLLLTALRTTYTALPDRRDVLGETFVGLLDASVAEASTSQTYSASLQVVLRGLLTWMLTASAGSQTIRTNLYAALLAYLRIGRPEAASAAGAAELSEAARLRQANLEVVQSHGTSLLEVVARDATTGHDVRRMLALAVLEELVGLDRQAATVRFLSCQGFLKHLVDSLGADHQGLADLLTKPGGNVRYLYVFEAKLGLLVRMAAQPAGAELLLQAGLMARLAELPLVSLRPDLDAAMLQQAEVAALDRYHAVLFPVLRLCLAVLASLGGDNVSAAAQVLQVLAGHEETVSLVLRGAAARASLHPALLRELALVTAVASRAAALDLRAEAPDAASLELAGQQARLQRQLLALLTQFQLTDGLLASLASAQPSPVLPVLQIIANCVAFARALVSASSSSSRSCRLVVTPSLQEETPGPASARPASLGLLVLSARRVAGHLLRARAQLGEARDRLQALPSLPLTELTAVAQVTIIHRSYTTTSGPPP